MTALILATEAGSWRESLIEAVDHLALGIGLVGIAVLVYGVVVGLVMFVRLELCRLTGRDAGNRQGELRRAVGFYILLALELLIVEDIIETIIEPSLEDLYKLGLIVLIRTVLSFSLSWELKHAEPAKKESG
jgi:uncharacterized membrane protein